MPAASSAPMCRLCHHAHWLSEPHVFDGPAKPLAVVEDEAPVSEGERMRLEVLEAMIEPRLRDWFVVGDALAEISSARLYRANYHSFEAYCRERWQISRRRGYQMIEATESVHQLHTFAPSLPPPPTERVARALAPLRDEPEEQAAAWKETVDQYGDHPNAPQTAGKVAKHGATREAVTTPDLLPGEARKAVTSTAPPPAPPPDRIAMAVSAAVAALLHLDELLVENPERAEAAVADIEGCLWRMKVIGLALL